MRGPFSVTHRVKPETGEKTLFPAPAELAGIRFNYCGVRTRLDHFDGSDSDTFR